MNTQLPPSPPAVQRNEAVLSLIGNTPLVALHFEPEGVTINAKCEFLNPSGSIKDRLAQCVILDAEARGMLGPDSIILECTSGNTGISLAMTHRLNRHFGLLVGTSSGANVAAAVKIARDLPPGACVVTLLCDRADRYFSTRLFHDPTATHDIAAE